MDLRGQNGVSITLRPDGYQFPDAAQHDWDDANWLMIEGEVDSPDGAWRFRDPCMQTHEAQAFGAWIDAVSRGAVAVHEAGDGNVWPEWTFIEPNVAFGVEGYEDEDVVLRVYFSLESAPEWAGDERRSAWYRFFLGCRMRREDVRSAGQTWLSELARWPERGERGELGSDAGD